ncbi:MAG: hypothetical protein AAGU19_23005 [Prolixibacteraceae bacterium]
MTIQKITLVILGMTFSSSLFSQTLANNFEIDEERHISWKSINQTALDFNGLVEAIEASGYYKEVNKGEDYVSCEFEPFELNFQKYGYKSMTTPFYVSRNLLSGNAKFEYKEGRYRVTITNILFTQNADDPLFQQGEQHSFEWWVLNNKGKLKSSFFDPGSDIMNREFQVKTSFSKRKTDDIW